MDSLDEQMTGLQLNKKSLTKILKCEKDDVPKTYSPSICKDTGKDNTIFKKVGPAVPPKPVKEMPQVPQSCIVPATCEPLYSKRLQITCSQDVCGGEDDSSSICISLKSNEQSNSISPNSGDTLTSATKIRLNHNNSTKNRVCADKCSDESNVNRTGKIPILLRKQPPYEQQHHVYSNIKMTLDNPTILDQQLEALEHHKKQLEKKGLFASITKQASISCGPKLSSASYVNGELAAAARCSPSVKMMAALIIENQQKQQDKIPSNSSIEVIPHTTHSSKLSIKSNVSSLNIVQSELATQNNRSLKNLNILSHQVQKNINQEQKNNEESLSSEPQNIVYSNIMHSSSSNKYNLPSDKNVYTNVQFKTENVPHLLEQLSLVCLQTNDPRHCSGFCNQQLPYSISNIEDELPLPPSPVSSSYSELRRASDNCQILTYPTTDYPNDLEIMTQSKPNPYINTNYNEYGTYGGPSTQGSSTYESIYEPITINPTKQITSRSNFSLYTYDHDVRLMENNKSDTVIIDSISLSSSNNMNKSNKKIEIQNYSDIKSNSLDPVHDVDSYGLCVTCGNRVVGENSGCTAMDQIYHISCFTCTQCQINLQGKPFYALENKPYCEEDYLNTLEKCSVCMKPILERILRATGKPYHPQCFTCVVCGNSLDGIPFTVDATNQNYCIQDFHKKFAPRCCVCHEPIMPDPGQEETVRVVALDRSFHFECYRCEDCALLLSSEAEGRGCYPLDDHVLCKSCNAKRVQALTSRMSTEL